MVMRRRYERVVIQSWQPTPHREEPEGDGYGLPDRTRLALVLGIISLLCGPLGLAAWAVGEHCLRAIAAGRMDPSGEANAKAGRVLGIVAMCMFVVKVIGFMVGFAFEWWPMPF
jgi:hypothetical protein